MNVEAVQRRLWAQATHLLNLQTLCQECHKEKTYAR